MNVCLGYVCSKGCIKKERPFIEGVGTKNEFYGKVAPAVQRYEIARSDTQLFLC